VIVVMIVVLVTVPPLPVFPLFLLAAAVEIHVVAMVLDFPSLVVHTFVAIPNVIITILCVVHADASLTAGYHHRGSQSQCQHDCSKISAHGKFLLAVWFNCTRFS
jgi:hypothetical protein